MATPLPLRYDEASAISLRWRGARATLANLGRTTGQTAVQAAKRDAWEILVALICAAGALCAHAASATPDISAASEEPLVAVGTPGLRGDAPSDPMLAACRKESHRLETTAAVGADPELIERLRRCDASPRSI